MSNNKNLLPLILILFPVILTACCGCGSTIDGDNTVKGYIEIIGNEPFTKLALKTADNKTFVLQCGKELKDMLWKSQGAYYYVKYGEIRQVEGYSTLIVEKVIPLTKDDK